MQIKFAYSFASCGGSLINNETVLSVAHCFVNPDFGLLEHVEIYLGEYNIQNVTRDSVTVHPLYNPATHIHDIAKVHLDPGIDWAAHPELGPVCLPETSTDYTASNNNTNTVYTDYTGYNATATGYNSTATAEWWTGPARPAAILQEMEAEIISRAECVTDLEPYDDLSQYVHPSVICAKADIGRTCRGTTHSYHLSTSDRIACRGRRGTTDSPAGVESPAEGAGGGQLGLQEVLQGGLAGHLHRRQPVHGLDTKRYI
jgi:secreted trypsin-like serine protease